MTPTPPSLADEVRRLKPPSGRHTLPSLILMTDRTRLADPLPVVARLPRGSAVILREPDDARRRALAVSLAVVCRRRQINLLIAADCRLAAARWADGLHLPEAAAGSGNRRWQRLRRPGWLVTAAAHSARALRRAGALGIDAALLSPVFATASHPGAQPIGPLRFARMARLSPLPVIALGGLDGWTARRLAGSKVAGFAAIGGLAVQAAPPAPTGPS